jgi:hypothetical protein
MLNSTLLLKVKQRLNKLDSQDYENLECWQIIEAFNKGQIEWCRRQLTGKNQTQQGDEQTTRRVDDLQILLQSVNLTQIAANGYYESGPIPADYLEYNRVDIMVSKSCCPEPKKMIVYLAEETNLDVLLRDELRKPNFEWAETFCTLVGNHIRIYTNNEFTVDSINFVYYRKPVNIQITGCGDPYTGLVSVQDTICEFKDDIVEVLIDNAAGIIAGDIESQFQYQRTNLSAENNN